MKTILISAGHGAGDPGVVVGKFREADMAVALRNAIVAQLEDLHHTVITDGQGLTNLPLKQALALTRKAAICVEFHFNAAANPAATGVEALCHPKLKPLAQQLCEAVSSATGLVKRGEGGWRSASSGQHHRLAICDAGGIVLEFCFLTNPSDRQAFNLGRDRVIENLKNVFHQAAL